jgi:hypothetical protein
MTLIYSSSSSSYQHIRNQEAAGAIVYVEGSQVIKVEIDKGATKQARKRIRKKLKRILQSK